MNCQVEAILTFNVKDVKDFNEAHDKALLCFSYFEHQTGGKLSEIRIQSIEENN